MFSTFLALHTCTLILMENKQKEIDLPGLIFQH